MQRLLIVFLLSGVAILWPRVTISHEVSKAEMKVVEDKLFAGILVGSGIAMVATAAILEGENRSLETKTLGIAGGAAVGLGTITFLRASIQQGKLRKKQQEEEAKAEIQVGLGALSDRGRTVPAIGLHVTF